MKNKQLLIPANKDYGYGYESAYKLAVEQMAGVDIKQQCLNSEAQYLEAGDKKAIIIGYLNKSYQIALPDIEISMADGQEEVPIRDKLLLLHYFIRSKGTPLSNRVISYKELPEGGDYFPTFVKRAVRPLLKHFGDEPGQLVTAAEELGGHRADYGDAAVTINAFRRVPITIALWRGDDEFAPEGSILFDSTVSDYLSPEDINVLCETISWRLVRILKEAKNASA
jgi:hypothetical protein